MPLELLSASPKLTISYDTDNDWLYVSWHGPHDQESARLGCLQLLAVMRERPTAKVLNDNSNVQRADLVLSQWGIDWLGQMHALGLRFLAWVYAPEFASREPTEALVRYLASPTVVTFDDLASAYHWLRQQRTGA